MIASRRDFFRFGVGAATTSAVRWPLTGILRTPVFEPSRSAQDQGLIRLNNNENAYGPSEKVADAVRSASSSSNRYPYMQYETLAESIANLHRVKPEQVLLGCGSTEILRVAASAFLGNGKQMIQALPTFGAMEQYARASGSEVVSISLTPRFAHDLDSMLARANASTTVIYICNPNNPTATLTPRKDLEKFISALSESTVVVIDEAYHHYAGSSGMYASFIDRPLDDEKIIVVRTFSKVYGLAGLRLGYAVASPKMVQQLRRFTTENNINAIATRAAAVALDDANGVSAFVQRNANDRQEFFNQAMTRALKPIDSHTNFVMMNTFHPAKDVIEHFRKNNILIGHSFSPMDTYIRVSLGRKEEMLAFWRAWDMLPYSKNIMHH
jgi:histidinol-phosphate aminotransferase